jgi:hypothetical protein
LEAIPDPGFRGFQDEPGKIVAVMEIKRDRLDGKEVSFIPEPLILCGLGSCSAQKNEGQETEKLNDASAQGTSFGEFLLLRHLLTAAGFVPTFKRMDGNYLLFSCIHIIGWKLHRFICI